ncbi:MAG: hypothetical protein IJP82_05875 [Bacteroidaceae bacterium]|nr:hypothetical protein [Bacteroidaceae bacterium]
MAGIINTYIYTRAKNKHNNHPDNDKPPQPTPTNHPNRHNNNTPLDTDKPSLPTQQQQPTLQNNTNPR